MSKLVNELSTEWVCDKDIAFEVYAFSRYLTPKSTIMPEYGHT